MYIHTYIHAYVLSAPSMRRIWEGQVAIAPNRPDTLAFKSAQSSFQCVSTYASKSLAMDSARVVRPVERPTVAKAFTTEYITRARGQCAHLGSPSPHPRTPAPLNPGAARDDACQPILHPSPRARPIPPSLPPCPIALSPPSPSTSSRLLPPPPPPSPDHQFATLRRRKGRGLLRTACGPTQHFGLHFGEVRLELLRRRVRAHVHGERAD